MTFSLNHETVSVRNSDTLCQGFSIFHTAMCSSTMDIAWLLHEKKLFPVWAAVLSDQQNQGRGQFNRSWISNPGNLYTSIRLPVMTEGLATAPLITALAVNKALEHFGVQSEFKWPNDILVQRKKIGGILVEQRSDTVMAGIGINVTSAPSMSDMRDTKTLSPGHLGEWGVSVPVLDIWPVILHMLVSLTRQFSDDINRNGLISAMENIMAFTGENVVFSPPSGPEFTAVITGLSSEGGIQLKTVDGEKNFLSGSFFPVVH